MSTPIPAPGRNDPCSCGSGRKYKHCCGARAAAGATTAGRDAPAKSKGFPWTIILAFTAVGVGGYIFQLSRRAGEPAPFESTAPADAPAPVASGSTTAEGGARPADWYYDATLDRHWDPTPGHNHWHQGPPPVLAGLTPNVGATPEPWSFDAVNNRHWNPLPGHMHWHDGPPPPESERK